MLRATTTRCFPARTCDTSTRLRVRLQASTTTTTLAPGQFIPGYWWNQNRIINRFPANGAAPRVQETDLDMMISAHPTFDEFWRARCAWERLPEIKVPLYSIGIWGKIDLHTRGNIDGFRRAKGPRKLQMRGGFYP